MAGQQHVCLVCGYNMIGPAPERCPFCGAGRDAFVTSRECSARFRVEATAVTDRVLRLGSVPPLGIEHAAYRVETGARTFWIDCPSSFDSRLAPADVITFTHCDFLGACNQYRDLFGAEVWIHAADAAHPLARPFPFDRRFDGDFVDAGLEARYIDGHSAGFTVYLFEDLLFVCDLVVPEEDDPKAGDEKGGGRKGGGMHLNRHGPPAPTLRAARRLHSLLEGRAIATVCGWAYVLDYGDWKPRLDRMLADA